MRRKSFIAVLVGLLVVGGCSDPKPTEIETEGVAPSLEPPPPAATLDREQVLSIASKDGDPGDLNRELDRHPFEFELDSKTLKWFEDKNIPADVLDYLNKRSRIDWEAERGDIPE